MFTRCPSCRSEISFEAPANIANLPDGYKHRIICPNCGVTIGVKIARPESYLSVQPSFRPANPHATSFEPIYDAGAGVHAGAGVPTMLDTKPAKKTGRSRNAFMFIFSIVFVMFGVLGGLIAKGVIDITEITWLASLQLFDAITPWENLITDFEAFKLLFESDIIYAILTGGIIPMVLFTLAAINAIISLSCFIAGKYSRAYNFMMSLIIGALAVSVMFIEYLLAVKIAELFGGVVSIDLGAYFESIIKGEHYLLIVGAGIGALQAFFSLIYLKSMKVKNKSK